MNDGALGFGVDDTSCLGLSDDEDVQRAPSDGSRARGGPAAPAPAAPAPSDAGLGSGQLALRALEMLRRTHHPTAAPSDAAVATPRAATSQPVQDVLREPPAFAGAARVASQAAPPPAPATRPMSSPRAAGLGTGTGRPGGVLPAVAMTVGTGAPLPGAIPGPAGSISPDAALVPPTQFLRGPCKKKRVSRTPRRPLLHRRGRRRRRRRRQRGAPRGSRGRGRFRRRRGCVWQRRQRRRWRQ